MTGHCLAGRHGQCSHRSGGPADGGIWTPECYITKPAGRDRAALLDRAAKVVRPSHRYRCSCHCHDRPMQKVTPGDES